jgi:membrane protein YdbS with pleckstrin-like domain
VSSVPPSGGAATDLVPPTTPTPPEPPPAPARTLAPEARGLFTLQALGGTLPLAGAGLIAALLVPGGAIGMVLGLLAVAAALLITWWVPALRVRSYRYAVREEEIDLQHGVLSLTRTLVPMVRVQHVDTHQTVLSKTFGMAAVRFHTAAGALSIPALRQDEADAIRDRIAELARTPEDV